MGRSWYLGLLVVSTVAGLVTLILALRPTTPPGDRSIVYLLPSLPRSLDPVRADDEAAGRIIPLLFEGLVRYAPGSSALEPALASSWEVYENGRVWLFHLRPGVVFHDGTPLTSETVKESVTRALSGAPPASYPTFVYGAVEKVETPDPLTVKFTLKYRYVPFLSHLAIPFAAPVTRLNGDGIPVGTGPFMLSQWARGRRVVVTANDAYWGGRPDIDRIVFITTGNNPRTARPDKAHIAEGVTPEVLPPGYRFYGIPRPDLAYLGFYVNKETFRNPLLRQAVAHALNRDLLVEETGAGAVMPARGFLPPVLMDHQVALPAPDPSRAARLLKAAGYPDGLEVTLITHREPRPYNPTGGRLAEAIARQLAQANIRVTVRPYDWRDYKVALLNQEGDFFLYGWTADSVDPDNFFQVLLTSSQVSCGLNASHYSNREVDTLLARAQATVDTASRKRLYRLVHGILVRDLPWLPLFHGVDRVAVSDRVNGFLPVWNRTTYLACVDLSPANTTNEDSASRAQ